MPTEYYLAPVELIIRGSRESTGSRVERYRDQMADPSQAEVNNFMPAAGIKQWCVTALAAPQEVHDAIAADAAIVRVPTNLLSRTWGELSTAVQNAILGALAARRVPTDWITSSTTIRQIIGRLLRVLDLTNLMGTAFPEADLAQTYGTLSAAQRAAIRQWCDSNSVDRSDFGTGVTIGTILNRLVTRFNWQPFGLLGEAF